MNKTVANEVRDAYSDCHEFKAGKRNLGFLASEAVSLEEAVQIMSKYVSGYNEFSPELLYQLPKDVQVVIAREGSVCMYLQLPSTLNESIFNQQLISDMKIDEFSVEEDGKVRLWWD